jgi:hypothetical protein
MLLQPAKCKVYFVEHLVACKNIRYLLLLLLLLQLLFGCGEIVLLGTVVSKESNLPFPR